MPFARPRIVKNFRKKDYFESMFKKADHGIVY